MKVHFEPDAHLAPTMERLGPDELKAMFQEQLQFADENIDKLEDTSFKHVLSIDRTDRVLRVEVARRPDHPLAGQPPTSKEKEKTRVVIKAAVSLFLEQIDEKKSDSASSRADASDTARAAADPNRERVAQRYAVPGRGTSVAGAGRGREQGQRDASHLARQQDRSPPSRGRRFDQASASLDAQAKQPGDGTPALRVREADPPALQCPSCGGPVSPNDRSCCACRRQLVLIRIACPDCGKENNLLEGSRNQPCVCGNVIEPHVMHGRVSDKAELAAAIGGVARFRSFSKTRNALDEVRYTFDTGESRMNVVELDGRRAQAAPPVTEKDRGFLRLGSEIALATDVLEVSVDDGSRTCLCYRHQPGLSLSTLAPADLAIGIFDLLAQVYAAQLSVPELVHTDLDASGSGAVRLLAGHRLRRWSEMAGQQLDCSVAAPELIKNRRSTSPRGDVFTAARIWYRAVVGGLLGDDQPATDEIPCPLIFRRDVPAHVWLTIAWCLEPEASDRPHDAEVVRAWLREPEPSVPLHLEHGFCCEVGRKADGNQEDMTKADEEHRLFVVSDGVSQSGWGERASSIVAEVLTRASPEPGLSHAGAVAWIADRIAEANREIGRVIASTAGAAEAGQLEDPMSATVLAAYVTPSRATIVALGDSRAYLLRGRRLTRLTEDQNVRWEHLRDGKSLQEALSAPDADNLACWVGDFQRTDDGKGPIDPLRPRDLTGDCQAIELPLRDGDRLLLCTDGVSDFLDPPAISASLGRPDPPDQVAMDLVRQAVRAQSKRGDNATAVVIQARLPAQTTRPHVPRSPR